MLFSCNIYHFPVYGHFYSSFSLNMCFDIYLDIETRYENIILIYRHIRKKLNICMLDASPVSTYFLILCKRIGIQGNFFCRPEC